MRMFELLPRPLGSIFRKLTHLTCNSRSIEQYKRDGRDHLQVSFGCTGGQLRSVYFAERMAERLSGIEDVELEVSHTAKQYWTTNHAKENRDIIFQEELR